MTRKKDCSKKCSSIPSGRNWKPFSRGRVYPVTYGSWVAERNIGGANRILDDLFEHLLD